jgi:hypothetical protein
MSKSLIAWTLLLLAIQPSLAWDWHASAGQLYTEVHAEDGQMAYSIADDSSGELFIGGKDLRRWNGLAWSTIEDINGCWAVEVDHQGRIWAAGSGQLHCIKSGPDGIRKNQDLTNTVAGGADTLDVVWNILPAKGGVLIVAKNEVIFHDGEKSQSWPFEIHVKRLFSFIADGKAYVYNRREGLYVFNGEGFDLVLPEHPDFASGITGIVPHPQGLGWLVATLQHGFYTWDGHQSMQPAFTELPDETTADIIRVIRLNKGELTYITPKCLIILNRKGRIVEKRALPSGFFNDLHESPNGDIWAASTTGVWQVQHPQVRVQRKYSGIHEEHEIQLADQPEQTVDLISHPDYYEIRLPDETHRVESTSNSYGVFLSRKEPGRFLRPRSGKLELIEATTRGLETLASIDMPFWASTSLELNDGSTLWAALSGECYHLAAPQHWPEDSSFTKLDQFAGWPAEDKGVKAFGYLNGVVPICVTTDDIYRVDLQTKSFHHILNLADANTPFDWSHRCIAAPDGSLVIARSRGEKDLHFARLRLERRGDYSLSPLYLPNIHEDSSWQQIYFEQADSDEQVLVVKSAKQLSIFNLSTLKDPAPVRVHLDTIMSITGLHLGRPAQLEPNLHDLRISFASAIQSTAKIRSVQTWIEGLDADWVDLGEVSYREITNLQPGRYNIKARAVDEFGRIGPVAEHAFYLIPPLWRTWWAYTLYVLAGLGLIYIIARTFALALNAYFKKEIQRLLRKEDRNYALLIEVFDIAERITTSWRTSDRTGWVNGLEELNKVLVKESIDIDQRDPLTAILHKLNESEKTRTLTDDELDYRGWVLQEIHQRSQRAEQVGWEVLEKRKPD